MKAKGKKILAFLFLFFLCYFLCTNTSVAEGFSGPGYYNGRIIAGAKVIYTWNMPQFTVINIVMRLDNSIVCSVKPTSNSGSTTFVLPLDAEGTLKVETYYQNQYGTRMSSSSTHPIISCPHERTIVKAIPPTLTETGAKRGVYCQKCGITFEEAEELPALNTMSVLWLPASLKTIKEETFVNIDCEAVIIPDGCRKILGHAFLECWNLRYVYIPESIEFYSIDAFEDCNTELYILSESDFEPEPEWPDDY